MGKKILKSISNSIAHSFIKDKIRKTSPNNYLVFQAHPDDELLIAGLIQRLINEGNLKVITLTDGDRNTNLNRLKELKASYNHLGYFGNIKCFGKETEILNLISTEQGHSKKIPEENIIKVSKLLEDKINLLENELNSNEINRILVPEFNGGHFIHDITQVVAVEAAKKLGKVEVYEFPQYFLRINTNKEVEPEQIKKLIRNVLIEGKNPKYLLPEIEEILGRKINSKKDLNNSIDYCLGRFLNEDSPNLNDENIGMYNGKIRLTFKEIMNKKRASEQHRSQKTTTKRIFSGWQKINDFSKEYLKKVNLEKDYSKGPSTNICLYETVSWRPHVSLSTFKKIYSKLTKQPQNQL